MIALLAVLLATTPAHAELSPEAQKLQLCRHEKSIRENVQDEAIGLSMSGDSAAIVAFQKKMRDMDAKFKSLNCPKRLAQAAQTGPSNQCKELLSEKDQIIAQLDDLAAKGLEGSLEVENEGPLNMQLERVNDDLKKAACI
jgi:hypothetical protein